MVAVGNWQIPLKKLLLISVGFIPGSISKNVDTEVLEVWAPRLLDFSVYWELELKV